MTTLADADLLDESHKDEGHGPVQGCNYQRCGNPTAGQCPFVRDGRRDEPPRTFDLLDVHAKAALLDELADVLIRIQNHYSRDMS